MRLSAHGGTGPLPHPATQRDCMLWAAGWGSGPVPPLKSLFRDFSNRLSAFAAPGDQCVSPRRSW